MKQVKTLLRHCAESIIALALTGMLVACSSSGGTTQGAAASRVVGSEETPAALERTANERQLREPEREATEQSEPEPGPVVDLSIEPNLEEIDERTQRRYDSALAAMRAGDFLQAELELQELLLEEPGFPGPYVNLALIYKRDGRDSEARFALEQAVAIAPGFPPANNELGVLLRENGEFAAAEKAYQRALDTDPANSIAHLNLGILLDIYLQRADEALAHYNEYQASLSEPDETVARWIVDLQRRIDTAERVAQD